jgi:hypothetical protein
LLISRQDERHEPVALPLPAAIDVLEPVAMVGYASDREA